MLNLFPLQLLLFILPLGIDTLGVSISLGIKSNVNDHSRGNGQSFTLPYWLRTALLFSFAEAGMPLIGLLIGYAVSLVVSDLMHFAGALLLIGIGAWELWEEGREYLARKRKAKRTVGLPETTSSPSQSTTQQFQWRRQLLLALSVSLDELAVGFSFGTIAHGRAINPFVFCVFIGLQAFLVTMLGVSLGRALRARLKMLREWSELLSAALFIALGIWLLVA